MDQHRPNFLSGPYIDRRSEAREDERWVERARADPGTRYLFGRGSTQLVRAGSEPGIALLDNGAPQVRALADAQLVLLGWLHGERLVLADLPADEPFEPPVGTAFEELRPLTAVLPAQDAALMAYARALCIWRARHRRCGVCGSATVPTHAGHCLHCSNPVCARSSSRASTRPSSCW